VLTARLLPAPRPPGGDHPTAKTPVLAYALPGGPAEAGTRAPDLTKSVRAILVEAGAIQIVLSEASLYTRAPRTEVFRGQRGMVEFEPRVRLEVTAAESDVPRVLHAIRRIPGAGTYLQVTDARLTEAIGGERTPRT
jgi:nitrogen regulatory protein PII